MTRTRLLLLVLKDTITDFEKRPHNRGMHRAQLELLKDKIDEWLQTHPLIEKDEVTRNSRS